MTEKQKHEELEQLAQIVHANKLSELSKSDLDLERYADVLCFSLAYQHFSPQQFTQVCETIRLLLLKKYTEENKEYTEKIDKQTLSLQEQNNNLQRLNVRLQRFVIALMVITILTAAVQIYVALRPNSQLQQQIELLKAISLQQKAAPTVQSSVAIPAADPQKKKTKTEAKK